ncbi:hypothetical protein JXA80_06330 [bacterium]|nr:hypothetical protein [candidate division CSSED10-310 bacterium]
MMSQAKAKNESANTAKKAENLNIKITLNDLMVMGFSMIKGGFGLLQSLEKVIDTKFEEMVRKGDLKPKEAEKLKTDVLQSLRHATGSFSSKISSGVQHTLKRLNIATLDDLKSLEKRLDELLETARRPAMTAEPAEPVKKRTGTHRSPPSKPTKDTGSHRSGSPASA